MKYYCNPLNIRYRYQFNQDPRRAKENGPALQINRESADPSMILFEGKYYIFASMTLGVWVSEDLVDWSFHPLPKDMPLYDYAPDVRVMNGYVYFSASRRTKNCDYYRTKDIINGPYERIEGTFPFWDPNMFIDDDGRVYFYWGCSNMTPIYGVELNPKTLKPLSKPLELIEGRPLEHGYERFGEDNSLFPTTEEEINRKTKEFLKKRHVPAFMVPKSVMPMIRGMFANKPYIEGSWMDKHEGKYYLQYACPGTQFNVYGDGVYVADNPLGPFTLAVNNPYSYKPGGFLPGAGHGSSMQDKSGQWWHVATMRISVNHDFERRLGLWPAGFDKDGELFCNQTYGDWPLAVSNTEDSAEGANLDPWRGPAFMLLSYGKRASASSAKEGHGPENAVNENVQTFWTAASNSRNEWLMVDLGKPFDVRAIQINFADGTLDMPSPGTIRKGDQSRYIDEADRQTQWKLEGSADGEAWFVIEDKSDAATDLTHDFIVREEGMNIQYLRLSNMAVAFGVEPSVSGLRVFGFGHGQSPAVPAYTATRQGDLDMLVRIPCEGASSDTTALAENKALGYTILFGNRPDKLYHSYMVFAKEGEDVEQRVGALVKGREYYVRVDAFNENGITEGSLMKLE